MTDQVLGFPHIFKKGTPFRFSSLEKNKGNRKYYFSSSTGSNLTTIVNHCNNINQVLARVWLKIAKWNHFTGLQKDPINRSPWTKGVDKIAFGSYWNKLRSILKEGGSGSKPDDKNKDLEELTKMVREIQGRLRDLDARLPREYVSKKDVTDVMTDYHKQLTDIKTKLDQVKDTIVGPAV